MMARPLQLDPQRFFPVESKSREIAGDLFAAVEHLPILSPHGHTDPAWFASDAPFQDAASLLLQPDHYVLRMLYSQGVGLEQLGIPTLDGSGVQTDQREIWRTFAAHYHLFRGTPSRTWLDHTFATVFQLDVRLEAQTADHYFDVIGEALTRPEFRPRALFKRFGLEVLATTDGALDPLDQHRAIVDAGWDGRVLPTFRPDDVTDPERENFAANLDLLGALANEDISTWTGYLAALQTRRSVFRTLGATATDHGPATAQTADLARSDAAALYGRVRGGAASLEDAALFRAQMLTEMARMSIDDGMVMQLHAGSWRNHNPTLFARFGRDRGADIPQTMTYVDALKPLLDAVGNSPALRLILFTLDESVYARELAPMAGHYPALRLGPAWWFHDSPEGMMRFRRQTTETAGFYNTVGFNDDTRAFFSISARHDVARRVDCAYLAELVAGGRLELEEAHDLARLLTYDLAKAAYKL
jgi:glucuronate isomerase